MSVFLLQLLQALGTFWLPPSHAAKNAVYLRNKKRHPADCRRRHSATPIAAMLSVPPRSPVIIGPVPVQPRLQQLFHFVVLATAQNKIEQEQAWNHRQRDDGTCGPWISTATQARPAG